tara:strand:+ start:27 stop:1103 length:1077 start_codon:yes stop_codon:yes gene_type:complete
MPRGVAKKIDVKNVKGGVQVTVTDSEGNSATSGVWADESDADDDARRKLRFSLADKTKTKPVEKKGNMAKGKWDKRKIPESDKELRSLYMSPTTVKNMKGKAQNIKWEADHKAGKYGRKKSAYTYQQSSDKNPNIKGTRKQSYKDPLHDQKVSVTQAHKSRKTKGGGRETLRYTNVAEKFKHDYGEPSQGVKEKAAEGKVREIQDKSGKITKREYLDAKPKKKKTVKQKTTTYQGKKGDTIKPKTKESTTEYWRKSKKGPGYVPEKQKAKKAIKKAFTTQERAKRETDARVQKQIKSSLGDWASSDDFKKKMKSGSDAFKKKMKSGSASFKSKMKSGSDAFRAKMKADSDAFKKKMGG